MTYSIPTAQEISDKAHTRWEEGMSFEDFLGTCNEKEIVVVLIGKLNYQVENGGFIQWIDNGFSQPTPNTALWHFLNALCIEGSALAVVMDKALARHEEDVDAHWVDEEYYDEEDGQWYTEEVLVEGTADLSEFDWAFNNLHVAVMNALEELCKKSDSDFLSWYHQAVCF